MEKGIEIVFPHETGCGIGLSIPVLLGYHSYFSKIKSHSNTGHMGFFLWFYNFLPIIKIIMCVGAVFIFTVFKEKIISSSKEERSLKLISGKSYLPKKKGLTPRGEDSHFICDEKATIGVADGVGGWARKGIDSGKYSRQLMMMAMAALRDETLGNVDPRRVLSFAFLNTVAKGSSTACIITLRGRNLHAFNVGDSGFMLFRNKKCIYQSPTQHHSFNCPYQLFKSKTRRFDLALADKICVPVEPGDILVAGTDGLFDNMFPSQIEDVLDAGEGCKLPKQLASMIAESARRNSHNKSYYSPYQKACHDAGKRHIGGKIDDITVIVSHIQAL